MMAMLERAKKWWGENEGPLVVFNVIGLAFYIIVPVAVLMWAAKSAQT
jgi:predicted negative regulator of RcsB-dependent stress response